MDTWVKLAAWGVIGLVVFWVVLQVVSAILGFISWLIGLLVTLAIVVAVLGLAYYVLSNLLGSSGSTGSSRSRERERLFE